jgi:chaperonin cofactor prefoldin
MNVNDTAQQQSTIFPPAAIGNKNMECTVEEEIKLLKVTMAELTLGSESGRVYESSSVGSVFFLANRNDVRNRVRDQLEMRKAQLVKKSK